MTAHTDQYASDDTSDGGLAMDTATAREGSRPERILADMVYVRVGTFRVGLDHHYPGIG